ncbi:MAG: hypothetical protein O4803_01585 [Trichodesmium sp. St15_bin1_1]|nr:hypothetical protein [Trichodesmium sp. St18_bin1]MDE5110043.1 hypothetical protein [Trichodesmium sp. St7_bin2_1]MDE5112996.1 hypothetical protein [Trichodesmium sp. St15_bin1_1]MDE5118605.1 hypothetical protein [Trichodesmium sp. St2_bin2_1]MDE5121878.1 hypothetical protein [Trichodesmium sp. St19_bin1]
MKYLGTIDSVENFENHCNEIKFLLEKDIYYHTNRKMIDWMSDDFYGVHARIENLINRFGKYEQSLLFFTEKSGSVRLHRDSKDFGKTAFSVSSIDFEFIHHNQRYQCKAGNVYTFNSKLIHGIEKIESDRWCLVWWR